MNEKLFVHLAFGIFFLLNGLWHLFNHIKLHSLNPNSYTILPWFPAPRSRHLELHLTMALSSLAILKMLVLRPRGHHDHPLLLSDATAPSSHLLELEHSSLFLSLFAYAALASLLDLSRAPHPGARRGLSTLLSALIYLQGLFIIHFHSADHAGMEGRYHTLIQLILLACTTTTLLGIGLPRSFPVGFVRSLSVTFLGAWIIIGGTALWGGPTWMPKGCFLEQAYDESGFKQYLVTCSGDVALQRAKALANLQFSWLLTSIAVFGVSLYLALVRVYSGQENYNKEYFSPQITFSKQGDHMEEEEDDDDDAGEGKMLFGPMIL